MIVAIASVLTLARFSEAFLLLRAQDTPLGTEHAPVVMVVMALVYALCAFPAGVALDRGHGALLLTTTDLPRSWPPTSCSRCKRTRSA